MSVLLAFVALAGAPSAAVGARPAASSDAAVTGWIAVTLDEIKTRGVNPPRASRVLALVSVAMDRAAVRGAGRVHGAAEAVLRELFPDAAARLRTRAGRLSSARDRRAGRRHAAAVIRRGRSDGSDAAAPATELRGQGFWEPTPPGFLAPLEPLAGSWRPWNVAPAAIRPPEPPRPGEPLFDAEAREVYDLSLQLTTDQRRIAGSWADGAGTYTPPGHWNAIAIRLVRGAQLSTRRAARLFALLNTAQADAFIAAWEAKFRYHSLRPVTVIRQRFDPGWLPIVPTPPFPGYVSGHSSTSGAASTVLAEFFPRRARRLRAWAAEAAVSRLYGGIHFTADNDAGLVLGRAAGRAALAR